MKLRLLLALAIGLTFALALRAKGSAEEKQPLETVSSVDLGRYVGRWYEIARLKVSFFWPFSGNYWILELGPNYEYAVVGEPKRENLWILSREPRMDEELYRGLLDRAAAQGFDISRVIRTPHTVTAPADQ